jgi:hypothetical protein
MLSESSVELSDNAKKCQQNLARTIDSFNRVNELNGKMGQMSLERPDGLQSYIDGKFQQLEEKIDQKFRDIEARQSEKLNQILHLLQNMKK